MGFIVGTAVGVTAGIVLGAAALGAVVFVAWAMRDAGPRIVVPDYVPDAFLVEQL